jgi:hypothetical protein
MGISVVSVISQRRFRTFYALIIGPSPARRQRLPRQLPGSQRVVAALHLGGRGRWRGVKTWGRTEELVENTVIPMENICASNWK